MIVEIIGPYLWDDKQSTSSIIARQIKLKKNKKNNLNYTLGLHQTVFNAKL